MFLVRVHLRPSPIHGLGCFAAERISKGQEVWVFDPRIDIRLPHQTLHELPEAAREFFDIYGYVELVEGQKVVTLCGDFARHMNHADTPNVVTLQDPSVFIAARDIEEDEELTCDYNQFSLEFADKVSQPSHWGFSG
jgi:SET domain-containing protein